MKDTKQQWFKEAKYGLFIHWGLFSLLAGEYKGKRTSHISEWIMNSLDIPAAEYEKLAKEFNPKEFDAEKWVKKAKEWGMKYIVFTTKHHEGFAMYHSECNAYNVVDASPFGRDVLKELQLACEKYDMRLGVYYSQAQDWDDPDGFMYMKDNTKKNYRNYLDNKCLPQLRELFTNYGKISLIWFDTPMGTTKEESQEMIDLVKSLQPECIVSGRIGNQLGDYMTAGDNNIPKMPFMGDWEVPATLNDTWGFSKFDHNWKDAKEIIRLMVAINNRGGNYLLNIGPDGNGHIPDASVNILDEVGAYMTTNGEAIYGTKRLGDYAYEIQWGDLTCKDYKLFIHVYKPRMQAELYNIGNTVKRGYILGREGDIECANDISCEGDSILYMHLPEEYYDKSYYCICLEFEEKDLIFEPIKDC